MTGQLTTRGGPDESTRDFSKLGIAEPKTKTSRSTILVWCLALALIVVSAMVSAYLVGGARRVGGDSTWMLGLMGFGFAIVCSVQAWGMHRIDVAKKEISIALRHLEMVQNTNYDNTLGALRDNFNVTTKATAEASSATNKRLDHLTEAVWAVLKLKDYDFDKGGQRRPPMHQKGGEGA